MAGTKAPEVQSAVCEQCPWRRSNWGKRHAGGFYRKRNLRRLWNQIRGGGGVQSCHLTDTGHPDHVAAGAREGDVKECMGSVVLVVRELRLLQKIAGGAVEPRHIDYYLADCRTRRGLTRNGLLYYLLQRIQLAGTPVGAAPLPDPGTAVDDPALGRPGV